MVQGKGRSSWNKHEGPLKPRQVGHNSLEKTEWVVSHDNMDKAALVKWVFNGQVESIAKAAQARLDSVNSADVENLK